MAEQEQDTQAAATGTETAEAPKPTATVEDIGPARKRLTIEVPAETITAKVEDGYSRLNTDAAIPGFRRGRAPRRLIEKRFGESVRDDAKAQIISEAYATVVEDLKIEVLGEPEVPEMETLELPTSGPLTFKVEIEVSPKVTVPAFDSISVERPAVKVTDEMVQKEIDALRERGGKMKPEAEGSVQEKDFVLADVHIYAGENAGEGAEVISHHHGMYILINGAEADYKGHVAGIVVQELAKKLAGKKVGDDVRISMTGPANHENDKIKEQPITIGIHIQSIERMEPASIETLLEQYGMESEEQLRTRVRENAEQRAQNEQKSSMYDQVRKQLLDKVELELPEKMTGRQTARVLRNQAMDLAYRGVPEQQIEQQIAELRSSSEEEAKRQLKLFFILDQAAKDLNIEVNDQEVNGRITMMALYQGRRPEKLRQQMQRSGEIESLFLSIRDQKTLDKILESAKITDVDAPAKKAD